MPLLPLALEAFTLGTQTIAGKTDQSAPESSVLKVSGVTEAFVLFSEPTYKGGPDKSTAGYF